MDRDRRRYHRIHRWCNLAGLQDGHVGSMSDLAVIIGVIIVIVGSIAILMFAGGPSRP